MKLLNFLPCVVEKESKAAEDITGIRRNVWVCLHLFGFTSSSSSRQLARSLPLWPSPFGEFLWSKVVKRVSRRHPPCGTGTTGTTGILGISGSAGISKGYSVRCCDRSRRSTIWQTLGAAAVIFRRQLPSDSLSFTLPHPLGTTISFPFCRRGFVSSLSQRVLIWLIDGKRERDGIGSRWMGRWQGWQGTERNIS